MSMKLNVPTSGATRLALAIVLLAFAALPPTPMRAAPVEPVASLAAKEKAPFLDTLKEFVSIESGSADIEGLNRLSQLIFDKLKALGGEVEFIAASLGDTPPMFDTPKQIGRMVHARFTGTGATKILLIAHMDTVYQRGMLEKQPFRIDGKRAYGLGISDDKQGVAVILHAVAMLKAMNFRDYGALTVLINGDEEVSSPGSRATLTKLGAEHDAVFSFEASLVESDRVALSTAGIAAVILTVEGRASHAGMAPERGRNALYELAHQIMQMRDLSDPETGVKMNWTLASAGSVRNVIPAQATASADVRVLRVADYDGIEKKVRERIANKLIPDTRVEMQFERRRPPLEFKGVQKNMAAQLQMIYREIDLRLEVSEVAEGGGTDAAFAGLRSRVPVIERMGVRGFGAHSNNAEYIDADSIEPRLYLAARAVMDVAQGKSR